MFKIIRSLLSLIFILALLVGLAIGWDFYLKKPFALPELAHLLPWPMQTGLKIKTLRDRVPIVDRVVIVPDLPTFITAIQEWSLQGRWPILIDDPQYTPMFINRFKPAETIRLKSVKTKLPKGVELRKLMMQTLAQIWDANNETSLTNKWLELGWEPPGIVITNENDPAWPAALVLAADRGQPLLFLEGKYGQPNDTLTTDQWEELVKNINELAQLSGYPYSELGDSIDTVTIAQSIAVKYQSFLNPKEQLAVTDGLARNEQGDRWAVVGWLYGSSIRSVYQAMCAIFLNFQTAMLYDSYPPTKPWNIYEMRSVKQQLNGENMEVELTQNPQSNLKTWLNLAKQPWEYDLIFVNSRGNKDDFFVGNAQASFKDIPKLKTPAAIHFIHSFSATTPADLNTVAGQWLKNGAYAYVGSVHEPKLVAFVPPKTMIERMKSHAPFLVAARHLEMPPWKITTIGDPLITLTAKPKRIQKMEK